VGEGAGRRAIDPGDRLRSPILGSIGLAFLAINWKSLWYLVFSESSVPVKLRFFDLSTSPVSLFVLPIAIGTFVALIAPWITLFGSWAAAKPVALLRNHQFDQSHNQKIYRLQKEVELETEKAKAEEARERRAIEAAKRVAEAEEIEGSQVAEEIVKERQDRSELSAFDAEKVAESLEPREVHVISAMGEINREFQTWALGTDNVKFKRELDGVLRDLTDVRLEVELKDSLKVLANMGLADSNSQAEWSLTSHGYRVFDYIKRTS